jgi:hypothetical protein
VDTCASAVATPAVDTCVSAVATPAVTYSALANRFSFKTLVSLLQ